LGVALAHHGAAFSLFADGPKGLVKPRLHLIRRNKKEFPPSTHTHTHKITKEKKKKKENSKQKQERAIKKVDVLLSLWVGEGDRVSSSYSWRPDYVVWWPTIRFLSSFILSVPAHSFSSSSSCVSRTRNRGSHYRWQQVGYGSGFFSFFSGGVGGVTPVKMDGKWRQRGEWW
jgi:hypothetical protein